MRCWRRPRSCRSGLPRPGVDTSARERKVWENTKVWENPMSLVIEGGTIVAADRTYKADVLVEGETIKAIGEGLRGDSTLDAKDCFVLPGGIDPHTHLDMPFMGTNSADNYASGTKAALSGGTTIVLDFCIPNRNQPLMEAFADWQKRSKDAVSDYSYHM